MSKRKPRGFSKSHDARIVLKIFHTTNILRSLLTALGDHVLVLFGAVAFFVSRELLGDAWAIAFAYPLALLINARAIRGLEVLVHEASHWNWHRHGGFLERLLGRLPWRWAQRSRSLNDLLANLLAAFPTFTSVSSYRVSHRLHHGGFGNHNDPCRGRFENIDREQRWRFVAYIMRGLWAYVAGWWMAFGLSPKTFVVGLAWHLGVLVGPLSLFVGIADAAVWWILFWGIPFFVALPILRFLAESAKHNYEMATEREATISNVGWIHSLLLHPHGDGYHLLHHWDPSVPHHSLARTHRALLLADPEGYGDGHLHRQHIFQNPIAKLVPDTVSTELTPAAEH